MFEALLKINAFSFDKNVLSNWCKRVSLSKFKWRNEAPFIQNISDTSFSFMVW